MLNKKSILLVAFLVTLFAVSAASAADYNAADEIDSGEMIVDDNLEISDEDIIQSGSGTFTDLQNIIDGASEGSTINLEKDYGFDESEDNYTEISIEKSLTINGNNHKISGLRKNNRLEISVQIQDSTVEVTLKNISFINCGCEFESYYEDSIMNGKIENCNFYNRTNGGAVDFSGDDLVVTNSNFINCNESGSGGAIAINQGFCTVYDCNFINDTTDEKYIGGEIVVGSYIQYQSRGGAIFCGEDAQLSVYDSKFLNNNAICSYCGGTSNDGYGGAIHIRSDNCVVKNCYFEGNFASRWGDAIYWQGNYGNLDSCTFNNTRSVYGANDVYWVGEYGVISNCKSTEGNDTLQVVENNDVVNGFEDIGRNHEKDDGKFSTLQNKINDAKTGATVFLENDYAYDGIDANGISISKSLTIDGQGHVLDGLSDSRIISVDGIYSITLKNIKFKNAFNRAIQIESGYKPAYDHPIFNIINCEFDNNTAYNGGAIYCGISYVIIQGCTFNNNTAINRGGAIIFPYITVNLKYCKVINCTFNNNSAVSGGAIYSRHERFTVEDSIFNNNEATGGDGGAINIQISGTKYGGEYEGGHNSNIVKCEFNNNKAASYGGAVYVHADYCSLKSSIFKYNVASSGDAVYWDEGFDYTHGTISDCKSVTSGNEEDNIYIKAYSEEPKTAVTGCNITVKIPISIECSDVTKYFGGPQNYSIILKEGTGVIAGADVKFTVDGKTSTVATDSNGQASIDLNLPAGNYDVVSEYGDISNSSKVTVKSTVEVSDAYGTYSNSRISAAFIDTDAKALTSKQVTFKINGRNYLATSDDEGVVSTDIELDVGTYTVTAVNPVNNEEKQFKLTISKSDSKINLASSENRGVVTLTATLTPAGATGNVIFSVAGRNYTVNINDGKAILALDNLDAGNYSALAAYDGDKNLNSSASNTASFIVDDVFPVLTADAVTKTYGTPTGLVVNLADSKGNAIADAEVSVNINGKITPVTTDSNGQASMPISLKPAAYTAKLTYGDISSLVTIVVQKATPKITAKAKTFKKSVKVKKYTITLKNNQNKAIKKAKVTLKVNGKTYTAKTDKKGKATFKINKLTKKGKHKSVISYNGNAYYNKVTKKVKITVK